MGFSNMEVINDLSEVGFSEMECIWREWEVRESVDSDFNMFSYQEKI